MCPIEVYLPSKEHYIHLLYSLEVGVLDGDILVTMSASVVGVVMVTVSEGVEGVAGWIDRCVHHQICFRHYLPLLPSTVPVVAAVLCNVPCV